MGEVVNLNDYRQCELLASVNVYRQPDGSLLLRITDMDDQAIESVETVGERFMMVKGWLSDALPSLDVQAAEFSEPAP